MPINHCPYIALLGSIQTMQKSKELLRRVSIATLEKVNAEECEVLEERWLSDECMEAILKFMQRKQ